MLLDQGVLFKVFNVKYPQGTLDPFVVQIVHMKSISQTEHKYRMLLGDGEWLVQAVLEGICGDQIHNLGIEKGMCIKLLEYLLVTASTKRLLVLKNIEMVPGLNPNIKSKDLKPTDSYYQAHPEEDLLANELSSPAPLTPGAPVTSSTPGPRNVNVPTGRKVTMIETISPYGNKLIIKARVSYKGDKRTYASKKNDSTGQLINFNLLDELDEIRAAAFGEVVDRLERELEEGKVYYFLKFKVRESNPKFTTLTHRFELVFDRDTVIEECFDQQDVPKYNFNFVKLDQVQNLESGTIVDVIGVLKHVADYQEITSTRTGKTFQKRSLTIVDDLGFAIEVGVWNKNAVAFNIPEGLVVAFKQCKIGEFSGSRNLSVTPAGSFMANPELPESYRLKGWYDNLGTSTDFKLLKQESSAGGSSVMERRKTIAQVTSEKLGRLEKPDYFDVRASTSYIRTSGTIAYPACNNQVERNGRQVACNRKVIEDGDQWRCEGCNITMDEPHYRWILSVLLLDATGQLWATFFDEEAEKLLGKSANEMMKIMKEEDLDNKVVSGAVFEAALCKEYNFRIKAKLDLYNDEERVRYQVVELRDIDYSAESEYLANELEKCL